MQLIQNLSKVLVAGLLATFAAAELTKAPRGSGDVSIRDSVLAKRRRETVGQGKIKSVGPSDELYTSGLATCIGMAAVGTPDEEINIDKVLAHVSASWKYGYIAQFGIWERAVRDSRMTDLRIYISVPREDVQPLACTAMGDMIKWAKKTCMNLGVGCATLERKNEDVGKYPPYGTVLIDYDSEVFMEGRMVSY